MLLACPCFSLDLGRSLMKRSNVWMQQVTLKIQLPMPRPLTHWPCSPQAAGITSAPREAQEHALFMLPCQVGWGYKEQWWDTTTKSRLWKENNNYLGVHVQRLGKKDVNSIRSTHMPEVSRCFLYRSTECKFSNPGDKLVFAFKDRAQGQERIYSQVPGYYPNYARGPHWHFWKHIR